MPNVSTWEEKGLYRVFSGKISGEEVLQSNLDTHGDPRFDDLRYVINDFTQVSDFEVTESDIEIIAVVDDVAVLSNPKIKIALVVTLRSLLEWVGLYCEKMEDATYICGIFSTVEEARQWVDG